MAKVRFRREHFGVIVRKEGAGFSVFEPNERACFVPMGKRHVVRVEEESKYFSTKNQTIFHDISLSAPIGIGLQLLNICNSQCIYCFAKSKHTHSNIVRINDNKIKNICNAIAESSVLSCWVSGGEPTLVQQLPEYLSILSNAGIDVALDTNGRLLTLAKAQELMSVEGLIVRVSLDSVDAEVNDTIRGYTAETITGITNALSVGLTVQIQTVVNSKNISHIKNMYQQLIHWGIKSWNLLQLVDTGCARDNNFLKVEDTQAISELLEFNKMNGKPINIGYIAGNTSRSVVMIDSSGNMYTSDTKDGKRLASGNVLQQTFDNCWDNLPINEKAHLARFVPAAKEDH